MYPSELCQLLIPVINLTVYLPLLMLMLQVDCKHWTSLSPKHLLFLSCLKQFKSSVISFLDIIVPAFSVCLSAGSEAEIQLRLVLICFGANYPVWIDATRFSTVPVQYY